MCQQRHVLQQTSPNGCLMVLQEGLQACQFHDELCVRQSCYLLTLLQLSLAFLLVAWMLVALLGSLLELCLLTLHHEGVQSSEKAI